MQEYIAFDKHESYRSNDKTRRGLTGNIFRDKPWAVSSLVCRVIFV